MERDSVKGRPAGDEPRDHRAESLRVCRLEASGFRGIAAHTLVDFRLSSPTPASMILSGDNGTGKSSIVDALEYGLQGRLLRKRLVQSLSASSAQSWIQVTLSDGTTFRREGDAQQGKPHPCFAVSPFVIRRADIEEFWSMPSRLRLSAFRQYLRPTPHDGRPAPAFPKAQDNSSGTSDLKAYRDKLRLALSQRLGINVAQVPAEEAGLNAFAAKYLYRTTPEQYMRMRKAGKFAACDNQAKYHFLELRKTNREITQERIERKILKEGAHVTAEDMDRVRATLTKVSDGVTAAFKRISPAGGYIEGLEVTVGKPIPVALTIDVRLASGSMTPPEMILSEASLDLLAFLYYVMLAKESAQMGQAKLLILDDVLQSVDATIRVMATEFLMDEFRDWQLVFTVHDRLWAEQLRHLMLDRNHPLVEYEVLSWHPTTGPVLSGGSNGLDVPLRRALVAGSPQTVCLQAAVLLERLCAELSYLLPISITRRKGDRYTLGDLWPGVYKTLSKSTCAAAAEDVQRWQPLRNLVGAHYNEWAQSLSAHEARQFGEAVLGLFGNVRCQTCQRWVQRVEVGGRSTAWTCRCEAVMVESTKPQGH